MQCVGDAEHESRASAGLLPARAACFKLLMADERLWPALTAALLAINDYSCTQTSIPSGLDPRKMIGGGANSSLAQSARISMQHW